jgi:hypothetical protein
VLDCDVPEQELRRLPIPVCSTRARNTTSTPNKRRRTTPNLRPNVGDRRYGATRRLQSRSAANRHGLRKVWRIVRNNLATMERESPDGSTPVVDVFIVGRAEPVRLNRVETSREPEFPWVFMTQEVPSAKAEPATV